MSGIVKEVIVQKSGKLARMSVILLHLLFSKAFKPKDGRIRKFRTCFVCRHPGVHVIKLFFFVANALAFFARALVTKKVL
jgi:hypothetical protein